MIAHLGAQLIAGGLIMIALRFIFADNGGSPAFFTLDRNLIFWSNPKSYWSFITPYAQLILVPRGANLISLFVLFFLVLWAWNEKPRVVRRLVLLSAAFNLPLFFLFGYLDEIRNLGYEPIPDRTEKWSKSFWHMYRWLKANPRMIKYAKTGWPRLTKNNLLRI